jgi:hypothetical protein
MDPEVLKDPGYGQKDRLRVGRCVTEGKVFVGGAVYEVVEVEGGGKQYMY